MTTRSGTSFTDVQKKDALRLAKGLFESKVLVNRPPTIAQKAAYNAGRFGSVPMPNRVKKVKSGKVENQLVKPVWRPFSHNKSLGQFRQELQNGKQSKTKAGSHSNKEDGEILDKTTRLPAGVASLEPWITGEDVEIWVGIPPDPNCFVIMPSGFHPDVNCLPPLQTSEETLLERPVEEIKKYIPPKILHNYNYLESDDLFQCKHDRKQCGKSERSEKAKRLRTSEVIKQEIEDLEQLIQGYGNPNSSSIVNRYQYEINRLREMVIETLRDYTFDVDNPNQLESSIPVIHGDLFEFLERHDEIIGAIKEKRDACVRELEKLEQELRQDY